MSYPFFGCHVRLIEKDEAVIPRSALGLWPRIPKRNPGRLYQIFSIGMIFDRSFTVGTGDRSSTAWPTTSLQGRAPRLCPEQAKRIRAAADKVRTF
jgi:hypothetical protein